MTAITASLKGFVHEHDEIPAFHAAFLVVTILSAAVFNLGFFALAILFHMGLDFVKYRDLHHMTFRMTLKAIMLESISDIALFLLALTFAVYLNHTYMLSAVSGIVRSELTLIRGLGTLLPKVRIMDNILAIALNLHKYMHMPHPSLKCQMSRMEMWSLWMIVVCTALLVSAIFLFQSYEWDLLRVLLHELTPMF